MITTRMSSTMARNILRRFSGLFLVQVVGLDLALAFDPPELGDAFDQAQHRLPEFGL
jgi:hypothetical protein